MEYVCNAMAASNKSWDEGLEGVVTTLVQDNDNTEHCYVQAWE